MKNTLLLVIGCFFNCFLIAQNNALYFVELIDKKNNSFRIEEPLSYLSEKAIKRRDNFNIKITESDLPISITYINQISDLGFTIINKSKWLNAIVIESNNRSKIDKLYSLPFVKKITPLNTSSAQRISNKFLHEEPSEFQYGSSYNQINQIGVYCFHKNGYTGKGLEIAMLDAGFYKVDSLPAFARLRENGQILGTYDFVKNNDSVYEDHSHGMAVLSTIAGYIDGALIGTAPDANYWLLRTEDAAAEYIQEEIFWTIGAEFADSVGVDIINSSLGYSVFDDSTFNHSYADLDGNTTIITKAADLAASKGIFVCTSAGNSGGAPWFKITAPADADSVLTVGAVDSIGKITNFSGRGPSYDNRIKPDVCAKGARVTYSNPSGNIAFGGGTSFSSPIIAGAVACLWQANPGVSPFKLMDVIKQSADKFIVPDTIYGYGIPNFCYAHSLLNNSISLEMFENMEIYPNPFQNNLTLNFYTTKDDTIEIQILDVMGKLLFSQTNYALAYFPNVYQINEGFGLSSGMYFIRLRNKEKRSIKKIIKN